MNKVFQLDILISIYALRVQVLSCLYFPPTFFSAKSNQCASVGTISQNSLSGILPNLGKFSKVAH